MLVLRASIASICFYLVAEKDIVFILKLTMLAYRSDFHASLAIRRTQTRVGVKHAVATAHRNIACTNTQ